MLHKKRKTKTEFFLVLLMLVSYGYSRGQAGVEKPNILFIMTDQQSAEMMSCAGNKYLKTPALDKLASRGIRFELAYSPNPVCVPSRTAMVTGMYPSVFNLSQNGELKSANVPDNVLDQTMGKLIGQAGYECVFGGKTHWAKGLTYESTGFENLTSDVRDLLAHKCASFLKAEHEKPFLLVASFMNPHDICYMILDQISEKYNLPKIGAHSTIERKMIADAIAKADEAKKRGNFETLCPPLRPNAEFIRNNPENTYVNKDRDLKPDPNNPKPSDNYFYQSNYEVNEMTDEDWRMYSWVYHRLTEDVDRQIGIVLDALEESGLSENTIVVFTSDHGEMNGAHKKSTKTVFYDESSRVPFLIAGPGVRKGYVDEEHLISASTDLIPTFCDFAGLEIPRHLHGKSIKEIAQSKKHRNWRDFVVSENGRGRMLRTDNYKYIYYKDGVELLFDMEKDPGEMENLSLKPKYRRQMDRYKAQLKDWVIQIDDPVAVYLK